VRWDDGLGRLMDGAVRALGEARPRAEAMWEQAAPRVERVVESLLQGAEDVAAVSEKSVVRGAIWVADAGQVLSEASVETSKKLNEVSKRHLVELSEETGMRRSELLWAGSLPVLLVFILGFARVFPPLTAVFSGKGLYTYAGFTYGPGTEFDTTFLTWGTDYLIAVVMGRFAWNIYKCTRNQRNARLILASTLLIGSYSLSTLAGALAHHFMSTKLNTALFRTTWRICVGSVAAAGGFMGAAATELAKQPVRPEGATDEERRAALNFTMPVVPQFCWVAYSLFFFSVDMTGFFSMKRPACDIFLVGVTQAPPTVYLVCVLYARKSWTRFNVGKRTRRILLFGALVNILLLPGYDFMNSLNPPLGVANLILHSTLLVSWGSQAFSLLRFCRGLEKEPIDA